MNLEQKERLSINIIEQVLGDDVFMTFSGGKDSTVLLDLVFKAMKLHGGGKIKVIGIDTRYEFPETIVFTDKIIKKYNCVRCGPLNGQEWLDFEYIRATDTQHSLILTQYGGEDVKDGQWYCCAHKEPAMSTFLNSGKWRSWITGLRSDETEARKNVGIYQKAKNSVLKINPIIFWSLDEIWKYIKKRNLEVHPKYAEGYKSLGCKPCTEAGFREGRGNQSKFEDIGLSKERAGTSECGLHV